MIKCQGLKVEGKAGLRNLKAAAVAASLACIRPWVQSPGKKNGRDEKGRGGVGEGRTRETERRERATKRQIFKVVKLGNLGKKKRGVICTTLGSFLWA